MPAHNPSALDRMGTLIELAATTTDERALWHWANDIFEMIDSIRLADLTMKQRRDLTSVIDAATGEAKTEATRELLKELKQAEAR
ncbi:hypothetical protein ACN4DT_03205 [Corynebacterium macclintockiae]|uniref:hypothetical protein n=1 Tax=Corynebacterium macclintockiae TaxID=2913501 RepID=UPI003EB9460B